MNLTPQGAALSRCLFALHDKPERVKALYEARDRVPVEDLSALFGQVWTNSESLFDNKFELLALLHKIRDAGATSHMMTDREQLRLRALKAKGTVTVYRGAAGHNTNGFSWTTKREKAVWFANRSALDGKPKLVTATFAAQDIVACFNGRGEFEVLVDVFSDSAQEALLTGRVKSLPEIAVSPVQALAWGVQAYGDKALGGGEQADQARLQMSVVCMISNGYSIEGLAASFQKDITELESMGFTAKADEARAKLAAMTKLYDDPSVRAMAGHVSKGARQVEEAS